MATPTTPDTRTTPAGFASRAAILLFSGLVACTQPVQPPTFTPTTWQREVPPGWEPLRCTSGEAFAATTNLTHALAAGRCTRLGDLLDPELVRQKVHTVGELEAALQESPGPRLALEAWQVGADLQAQGTLLIHGLGTRDIDVATRSLAARLAAGETFDAKAMREIAYLAARDPELRRAFARERQANRVPSSGCSDEGAKAFENAMDAVDRAIDEPYETRWDTLFELDDKAREAGCLRWPSIRTYMDNVTVAQGRGRALAVAVGAVPSNQALDPVTNAPIHYDRDLCRFALTATFTLPAVEVSVPCR